MRARIDSSRQRYGNTLVDEQALEKEDEDDTNNEEEEDGSGDESSDGQSEGDHDQAHRSRKCALDGRDDACADYQEDRAHERHPDADGNDHPVA